VTYHFNYTYIWRHFDRLTSGRYYLGDVDVSGMDDDQLSEVRSTYLGFIFQSYNLLPQYTVVENIELPLLYQGIPLDEKTKQRCIDLAEMVGLGDRLDHRPLQLSGGQQQRVAIARSLVNDPHLILGDEPTGNLDTKTSVEIMQMLRTLNEGGKTIIMVTHENDIAEWAFTITRQVKPYFTNQWTAPPSPSNDNSAPTRCVRSPWRRTATTSGVHSLFRSACRLVWTTGRTASNDRSSCRPLALAAGSIRHSLNSQPSAG
jgi:ABC-type lipoprotein export system ATPase subunit